MPDEPKPMGRMSITWASGGVYTSAMSPALAASIMAQLAAGRWAQWEHVDATGDQRGAINPAHVADVVFTEAVKKP